jgi:phospholipase/carboxylesterase
MHDPWISSIVVDRPGFMDNRMDCQTSDWVIRQQSPPGDGPHPVILLLHGWTGDENSMWVFSSRMPKNAFLIAPRGLFLSRPGGYGWHPDLKNAIPWVDDFRPAMDALQEILTPACFPMADFSNLSIVGFSQGAALAYSMALLFPNRVCKIVGLSGFLPEGAEALARNRPLQGKPVFVAHGRQDDLVSITRARESVDLLEQAGAQVSYCEDDVGHKLSLACFKGLEAFLAAH